MSSFSEARLVCRPALASDAQDVLEFTKYIWEGHDYIKYVWTDWFADPQGLLAVAQYGPHAVGTAKVSLISPDQWWLEGLRVDPNYQGLKIGSHLHEYMDAWWLKYGRGTIRLMTSSQRVQVHHLCDRSGYTKVGEVLGFRSPTPHSAAPQTGQPTDLSPAVLEDLPAAVAFAASQSAHLLGLMDSGWRFSMPDAITLARSADAGRLYWWRARSGLLVTWEDDEDEGRVLAIGLAAIDQPSRLPDLLRDVSSLAVQEGFAYAHWLAPLDDSVQAALHQAGYETDWDHTAFLYAKPHPTASA
jgi:GNAT superfamily N-acetyltransferase